MYRKTVYLDNAASSFPKPKKVYKKVNSFIKTNGANPGRSGHFLSEEASFEIYETREAAAEYFSVSPENIIFTKNATESLNLVISSLVKSGKTNIMTSYSDHNSVLRPLSYLESEKKISLGYFDGENFTEDVFPDAIICTSASNVSGNLCQIEKIGEYCRKNNILFVIDASQTAGYISSYACDIVCTAGHKGLYGFQGSGIVAVKTENGRKILSPLLYGGNGNDSLSLLPETVFPESFECGTLSTPAIISLKYGIEFLKKNEKKLFSKEKELQKKLISMLSEIDGIKIYTAYENSVPTVAFNVLGISSENVTAFLSKKGICVRGGYHCAPLYHKKIGTVPGGAVRVSLGAFNTERDIKKLVKAIKELKKN